MMKTVCLRAVKAQTWTIYTVNTVLKSGFSRLYCLFSTSNQFLFGYTIQRCSIVVAYSKKSLRSDTILTSLQISNLETELSDGLKLISLIEVLSGKRMPKHNKKPTFRSQKLENVSIALQFLEREGVTLVNIDSTDIVDCKLKLILGLIWWDISLNYLDVLGVRDQVAY